MALGLAHVFFLQTASLVKRGSQTVVPNVRNWSHQRWFSAFLVLCHPKRWALEDCGLGKMLSTYFSTLNIIYDIYDYLCII